jgi:hypothetical protein
VVFFFFFSKNLTKLGFDEMGRRNQKCCTHWIFTNSFFTTFLLPSEFFFGFLCVNQSEGNLTGLKKKKKKNGEKKEKKKLFNF